jgi:hypothetical protein
MWILKRLLGLLMMLAGIVGLAKSIVIGTFGFPISTPAVFFCSVGILILVYGRSFSKWGWVAIGLGIVLTFASGSIAIVPTTLLVYLICFLLMVFGFKLFSRGRF